jgi:hypothetical protein
VTTSGVLVRGLYPLRHTDVSPQPMIDSAGEFLSSMNEQHRRLATFAVDDEAWRAWDNIHIYLMRHGVCLEDLTPEQRELALAMLRASLSASGFETARNVMKLNDFIGTLTGRFEEYGEWLYWMSVFGIPSRNEPWGWQLDGHHLVLNCFVLDDQVVLSPVFLGSEPVEAKTGKYAGIRVFEAEEAQALAFMRALTPAQREQATIGFQIPIGAFAAAGHDNLVLPHAGISYPELSGPQQRDLVQLLRLYTGFIRDGHADVRLNEVKEHLADTHFAWIGECEEDSVFYYRIQSPVILIEFDHQPGVAMDNDFPSRHHIHIVIRTPNGNDYGKDLLRQHYEQHPHHQRTQAMQSSSVS